MALVDLKSKLNKFGKNKNTPDNPYKKGDRESDLTPETGEVSINIVPPNTFDLRRNKYVPRIDNEPYLEEGQKPESELTKLDSDFDRENTPKSKIERDKKSSFGRSLKSFVEDFGRSSFDVPTTGNYEDSIKIESSDSLGNLARGVKSIENTVKAAKDILKGNVSKGIRTALEGTQENKLSEYNAKAYGKIKLMGEPGRRVSNIDGTLAKSFQGPIKGGLRSKNVNRANIQSIESDIGKDRDLVPFRFYDAYNDNNITFSAILSGITDTITPEYSDERYIGRPDSVYVYQGVTRALSFTFDVYPQTRQEMRPLWSKINYLVSLCYPNFESLQAPGATSFGVNQYLPVNHNIDYSPPQTMVSPIVELTIGDMYRNTPGFLSGVTMTVQDGTTWEFEDGVVNEKGIRENSMKLPHYVQIACEFTYIGKHLPTTGGKHFELNWVEPGMSGEFDKTIFKIRTKEERRQDRRDRAFRKGKLDKEGRLLDRDAKRFEKWQGLNDDSDVYNMFD